MNTKSLDALEAGLASEVRDRIALAVDRIVAEKERGGKVVVVAGSGPNLHEGVTTLIAELMRTGIVDGVTTSSAVVAHEMGGVLDRVKRVDGLDLGLPASMLPRGGEFELSLLDDAALAAIGRDMPLDGDLIAKLKAAEGKTIIKAAGNMAYPMGLWLERLAEEIGALARSSGKCFEEVAGLGCDPRTMLGAGAAMGLPVLVTIPQLVGGGAVGINIGDSISIRERSTRLARMLEGAGVIIESAVALTQEIHDGPYECHTGHGVWSAWQGHYTYSLEGKSLIRIDLDPALEKAWQAERGGGDVQRAIAEGLPKTKLFNVPFRMEMSGFARHDGSIPVIGDIGAVWPVLARRAAERLGVALGFMSYPQGAPEGQAMREDIVSNIAPIDRGRILEGLRASFGR